MVCKLSLRFWVAVAAACFLLQVFSDETCAVGSCAGRAYAHPSIPGLNQKRVSWLAEHGVVMQAIEPFGARVSGLDLRRKPDEEVLQALQEEMAIRGFLVCAGQGVLTGDEFVAASEFWGGRRIHSTHGVHPKAPNRHIFRLSNDQSQGILGVGPQWHNDGSFVEGTFSHAGYHIIEVPEGQGDTQFVHQGAAFEALLPAVKEKWQRLTSVNSNSGVLHPVVHEHPISKQKSVWLHLGMTGAVFETLPSGDGGDDLRLLEADELTQLFHDYNDLLNDGFEAGYALSYSYQPGDCIFIDNLAIAHRASSGAHDSPKKQGRRVLHRTTVQAMQPFAPKPPLPQVMNIGGPNPLGKGVWIAGGVGFRWDPFIRMQN
eukprot:TRINITY_DN63913_c0_g1_i1.p1 TRINITY_DN63913_c0_g1~~TRINITY_DN63913_c0_g1_i1.p1  ORF type:complete len:373 (-),score=61.52 TRINITY_DN63913_c0_g1_i1:181-1299(-)